MPPATLVIFARPPILPRTTSWPGPHMFFQAPTISIGTASGLDPSNTVQAMACIPGLTSEAFMISTLPALGGSRLSAKRVGRNTAAKIPSLAAVWIFINDGSVDLILHWTHAVVLGCTDRKSV